LRFFHDCSIGIAFGKEKREKVAMRVARLLITANTP